MVKCSLSELEQQYMAVYGDFLIIDDIVSTRLESGLFGAETDKLVKEMKEKEKRMHFLRESLPQTSTLYH